MVSSMSVRQSLSRVIPKPTMVSGYKEYKAVHILGLYAADLHLDNIWTREQLDGEVWSMTDWYRSYPWLPKLDRHYEVHGAVESMDRRFWGEKDKDRFPGDWIQKYRDCGAKMVIWDMAWMEKLDLPLERFLALDYKGLEEKYSGEAMSSTVSIMILEAIDAGFERIWLHGLSMVNTEHEYYVPGVIEAIDYARTAGIKISANYEHLWRERFTGKFSKGSYVKVCQDEQEKLRNYIARSLEAAEGTEVKDVTEVLCVG